MTPEELNAVLQETTPILSFVKTCTGVPLALLNGHALPVSWEPEVIDTGTVAEVVARLAAVSAGLRPELAKVLYAAAMQSFEDCDCDFDTPQAQLDWEAENGGDFDAPKVPERPEDIWTLVRFSGISVAPAVHGPFEGQIIASLRGSTAWDGEHGVSLQFPEGATFGRISDLNDT